MSQKKKTKTGFGIIVKGIKGNYLSQFQLFSSQTEKDHLNIFLGGKKNHQVQGSSRNPIKQRHHPNPTPSP